MKQKATMSLGALTYYVLPFLRDAVSVKIITISQEWGKEHWLVKVK